MVCRITCPLKWNLLAGMCNHLRTMSNIIWLTTPDRIDRHFERVVFRFTGNILRGRRNDIVNQNAPRVPGEPVYRSFFSLLLAWVPFSFFLSFFLYVCVSVIDSFLRYAFANVRNKKLPDVWKSPRQATWTRVFEWANSASSHFEMWARRSPQCHRRQNDDALLGIPGAEGNWEPWTLSKTATVRVNLCSVSRLKVPRVTCLFGCEGRRSRCGVQIFARANEEMDSCKKFPSPMKLLISRIEQLETK